MKRLGKFLSLLLALAMLFVLSACGKSGSETPAPAGNPSSGGTGNASSGGSGNASSGSSSGTSAQPSEPEKKDEKYGGTLSLVIASTLSNVIGYPIGGAIQEQVVATPAIETLARYDISGNIVGWLAKDIKEDKEGLKIVLTLNEGVKYHDGTDFNAKAVCDVWQICMDNGYASKFSNVDHFEATGEYEVTVYLTTWMYDTVARICVEAGWMFSPSVYEKEGLEGLYTHVVGTGAFILEDFTIGESLTYVRNDNYWVEGLPYLDKIEYILATDSTAASNILRSGDAQVFLMTGGKLYSELLAEGFERVGVDTCIAPILQGVFFATGNQDDPLGDVLVRKAFCYAVDGQAICDSLTYGAGVATDELAVKGTPEYNDEVAAYPYNPEKAKELLAQAGYGDKPCPITLCYMTGNDTLFVALQGYLEAVGFKVEFDIVDPSVYADRIVVGRSAPFTSGVQWTAPTKMAMCPH